jgi:PTH1 family peptidyl-tRNA hydrolase
VGLGNPGPEYEGSRHNVGGEVVRRLAREQETAFRRAPRRIKAEVALADLSGGRAVLAVPTVFMNESGRAVVPLVHYYNVPIPRLVLVHDDIDLPFGKLRFHFGRGTGGHNGVASVVAGLGSVTLWRLKLGVGRPPGRMDPADFVLRRFYERERPDVDLLVVEAAAVLRTFAGAGGEAARQYAGDATSRLGFGGEEPR